jgi:catechol 2,3-dioxygenase-like lactoylglutathione lyase family enzyme
LGSVEAITMFVADVARTKTFYTEVFAQQLVHEDSESVAFRFEHLIVNLLASSAAPELIEPAPVAAADAGARCVLTVGVDDVDAACERLGGLGVALLNGPIDRPWGVRTAAFADPDGHVWEIAAPIAS